jgi:hypothetical protein
MSYKYIFLGNMSRSGTSWTIDWLTRNPQLASIPELPKDYDLKNLESDIPKLLEKVYGPAPGKKEFLLVRTHRPTTQLDDMLDALPGSKAISLYRDGRDFVYGLNNQPWPNAQAWTIEGACQRWLDETAHLMNRPDDGRVLKVRYEDLLHTPAQESRRITEWLGLEHHRDLAPWDKPVNTIHAHTEARWKTMPDKEKLSCLNERLQALGYP